MKSFLRMILPGAIFTAAVFALIAFSMARAQSMSQAIAPASVPAPGAPIAPQSQPAPAQAAALLICGHCGEYLQQPQLVVVAMPLRQYSEAPRRAYAPPQGYYQDQAPSCSAPATYERPMPRANVFDSISPQLPACQFTAPVGHLYYCPEHARYERR